MVLSGGALGVGGLLVTGLYTIDPALFPRGVFYLGCFAIVIGALSLFGDYVSLTPAQSRSGRRTSG